MLLRLGDTIFTREKPLLWYSNKLSMAEHPARNACRELSETVTLERVSFLRCGKLGALALLAIFAVVSIIREDASFEAGDGESGAEAEHRWRERQRSTPRAKAVEFEEYIELPEAVDGGGPEPAVEGRGGSTGVFGDDAVTAEPSVADVEAAAGSRVRGEGAGDGAGGGAPRRLGEVEVKVEGSGAERQMRRHREERTCVRAGAVPRGEERDDVAEDVVREAADAVGDNLVF
jgi:hypothetical protein